MTRTREKREKEGERREEDSSDRIADVGSETNRRRKESEWLDGDGRVFGDVSRNQGKRCRGCLRVTLTFIGSRYDDASDR